MQFKVLLFVCLLSPIFKGFPQSKTNYNQISRNICTYTKIFGYINYFYPDNEQEIMNWDKFLFFGLNKIKYCKSDQELIENLYIIFKPIVPEIKITREKIRKQSTLNYSPADTLIFWQYKGYKYPFIDYPEYAKKKVKMINNQFVDDALFQQIPDKFKDYSSELEKNIFVRFPIIIPMKNAEKVKDCVSLKSFSQSINNYETDTISAQNKILSEIIAFWNVIQHFYPYHKESKLNWNKTLHQIVDGVLQYKSTKYTDKFLYELGVELKDGHFRIETKSYNNFYLPIETAIINNKAVVVQSFEKLSFKAGDIILSINKIGSKELIAESKRQISGSKQFKNHFAGASFHVSNIPDTALVEIMRNNKKVFFRVKRTRLPSIELKKSREINKDIYYLNLNDESSISNIIEIADRYNGIIIDWRDGNGNLLRVHQLIQHFFKDSLPPSFNFAVPQIIYPDRKNSINYYETQNYLKPDSPFFACKLVVLSSGWNISYDESTIERIKYNKLGTIIGEKTGGTNGSINYTKLPTGSIVGWTGMKCEKLNGKQHHLKGITPNILIKPTINGIKEGKDEVLQYAIKYLKIKLNEESMYKKFLHTTCPDSSGKG
ncbi:MAG: S41 family peptidase [Bacteroidales bacterium]